MRWPPDFELPPMEMPRRPAPLQQWIVTYELALCAVVTFALGFLVAFAYGQGGI